jgi:hypothetical protein
MDTSLHTENQGLRKRSLAWLQEAASLCPPVSGIVGFCKSLKSKVCQPQFRNGH